ncbi:MAG: hypothetical protein ACLP29_03650, partial [Dissulfurispiraceae bacterium]
MKYTQLDVTKIKTYCVKDRLSKVSVDASAAPHIKGRSFQDFIQALPGFLAVDDLKAVAGAIVAARENDRPVILGMGAHPIKVGLSSIIIDLIQKGVITALASNGASIIHDFEMSFMGQTSEDVARELCTGTFGMGRETGQMVNRAIKEGAAKGIGIGRSMGQFIDVSDFPNKDRSIFREAFSI